MSDDARERFVAFYRENYGLILATCMRRLGDRPTAEDAAADVFRVAWKRALVVDELTVSWLYGVARNVVGNAYRSRARTAALESAAADALRDVPDPSSDVGQDVRNALQRLRESDRELLFMAYWEDLSGAEIAEILGCRVSAVWVRLSRAREALRRELERDPAEVRAHG